LLRLVINHHLQHHHHHQQELFTLAQATEFNYFEELEDVQQELYKVFSTEAMVGVCVVQHLTVNHRTVWLHTFAPLNSLCLLAEGVGQKNIDDLFCLHEKKYAACMSSLGEWATQQVCQQGCRS
jgi:hypothetical protein